MGKRLIFNDVDFSANAVEIITPPTPPGPTPTPVVLSGKLSGTYVFYLAYQGVTNIQEQNPAASTTAVVANTKLIVYDVQQYVGKTVEITSANYVLNGAEYDCFASSLGNLTINDIENLSGKNPFVKHDITAIESFNVSTTTSGAVTTIQKVIPTGAKYLCVTARFDEGLTEQQLKAEIID